MMNKNKTFQVLTKKQQATILGGGQLCIGQHGGRGITVVEDNGYYFLKMTGLEPEVELTAREAANICSTFSHQNV